MTGFSRMSALSAAAGTAKLTANAPAAMPTIQPSSVRRLRSGCVTTASPASPRSPWDAVVSGFKVCFMANEGLLVEQQQESKDEAAGAGGGSNNGGWHTRDKRQALANSP